MSGADVMDPGIGCVIAGAGVLLFARAALAKYRRLAEFAAVLDNYQLFPARLNGTLAIGVPAVETAIALLLIPPSTRQWAAVAGALLLLAYAGAIAVNLRRGRRDLDCGCAGPAERRPIAAWMVWRNVAIAAALLAAGLPWTTRPLGWIDAITIPGALVVLTVLYAALDQLLGKVVPRTAALRGAR